MSGLCSLSLFVFVVITQFLLIKGFHSMRFSMNKLDPSFRFCNRLFMFQSTSRIISRSFSRLSKVSLPNRESFRKPSLVYQERLKSKLELYMGTGFGAQTKLRILKYPHPLLRKENEEVTVFDETLVQLCKDLLKLMYEADGVGLAAPQVGINKRIMVFNEEGDPTQVDSEMILINPRIVEKSKDTDIKEEACLSFPMILGRVERSLKIDIEYQDIKGNQLKKTLQGFPARIFQHEYDHLDQVLFIDRIIDEDKATNTKRLEKMIKKYGVGAMP